MVQLRGAKPEEVPSTVQSSGPEPHTTSSSDAMPVARGRQRQVQKFRFVAPKTTNTNDIGYRVLLATYADIEAASEENEAKAKQIEKACSEGGGFVGKHYYQYEVSNFVLLL